MLELYLLRVFVNVELVFVTFIIPESYSCIFCLALKPSQERSIPIRGQDKSVFLDFIILLFYS